MLFSCDIPGCDKKFGRNCELTRHKLNHIDVWPFLCNFPGCGRKFKRKDVYKNHQRTHLKDSSSNHSILSNLQNNSHPMMMTTIDPFDPSLSNSPSSVTSQNGSDDHHIRMLSPKAAHSFHTNNLFGNKNKKKMRLNGGMNNASSDGHDSGTESEMVQDLSVNNRSSPVD